MNLMQVMANGHARIVGKSVELSGSARSFSSSTFETALKEYEWLRQKGKKLPPPKEYAVSIVHEHEYSCLTGNMATALIRLGYGRDARVKKALEWLVKIQNKDGGWLCP